MSVKAHGVLEVGQISFQSLAFWMTLWQETSTPMSTSVCLSWWSSRETSQRVGFMKKLWKLKTQAMGNRAWTCLSCTKNSQHWGSDLKVTFVKNLEWAQVLEVKLANGQNTHCAHILRMKLDTLGQWYCSPKMYWYHTWEKWVSLIICGK